MSLLLRCLNSFFKTESKPVRSGFHAFFAGLFEKPLSGNLYFISPVEKSMSYGALLLTSTPDLSTCAFVRLTTEHLHRNPFGGYQMSHIGSSARYMRPSIIACVSRTCPVWSAFHCCRISHALVMSCIICSLHICPEYHICFKRI